MQRKLEEEPVHRLAILTGIKQPTCLDVQEQAILYLCSKQNLFEARNNTIIYENFCTPK